MYLFSLQLKGIHSDKTFIIRAYGSTMLSSIIDTLFVTIAFAGTLPNMVVFEIFITTYLLKLISTIFNVPFGYIAKSMYRKGQIHKPDKDIKEYYGNGNDFLMKSMPFLFLIL